jgi:hypothetical protein
MATLLHISTHTQTKSQANVPNGYPVVLSLPYDALCACVSPSPSPTPDPQRPSPKRTGSYLPFLVVGMALAVTVEQSLLLVLARRQGPRGRVLKARYNHIFS